MGSSKGSLQLDSAIDGEAHSDTQVRSSFTKTSPTSFPRLSLPQSPPATLLEGFPPLQLSPCFCITPFLLWLGPSYSHLEAHAQLIAACGGFCASKNQGPLGTFSVCLWLILENREDDSGMRGPGIPSY